MVYEFLPVKTTHHNVQSQLRAEDAAHLDLFLDERAPTYHNGMISPSVSVTVVHKTLVGTAIFATSRQIASEARAILQPTLNALQEARREPQIICNSPGFLALLNILKCLGNDKDISIVTENGHLEQHHSPLPSPTLPPGEVRIAVRNLFVDRSTASTETTEARMRCFKDNIYDPAKSELVDYYQGFDAEKPKRDLQIHTRMALLSAPEQEAFDTVRPLRREFGTYDGVGLRMRSGDEIAIDEDEWESGWAEGERYWV